MQECMKMVQPESSTQKNAPESSKIPLEDLRGGFNQKDTPTCNNKLSASTRNSQRFRPTGRAQGVPASVRARLRKATPRHATPPRHAISAPRPRHAHVCAMPKP